MSTTNSPTIRFEVVGGNLADLEAKAHEIAEEFFGDAGPLITYHLDAEPLLRNYGNQSVSEWKADVEAYLAPSFDMSMPT